MHQITSRLTGCTQVVYDRKRLPMAFLVMHWLKVHIVPTGQHCWAPGHHICPGAQAVLKRVVQICLY